MSDQTGWTGFFFGVVAGAIYVLAIAMPKPGCSECRHWCGEKVRLLRLLFGWNAKASPVDHRTER
jgi:hypothetical protein